MIIRSRNNNEVPKLFNPINVNMVVDEYASIAENFDEQIVENAAEPIIENCTDMLRQGMTSNNLSLEDSLRVWATTNNITHTCLRNLIAIVNPYLNNILPLDPRTLLQTPRNISVEKIGGGEFVYFGIRSGITKLLFRDLTDCKFPIVIKMQAETQRRLLSISVGIDGVPISNSSTKSFWPILGLLDQVPGSSPFIIGLFCGMTKPTDTLFLKKIC